MLRSSWYIALAACSNLTLLYFWFCAMQPFLQVELSGRRQTLKTCSEINSAETFFCSAIKVSLQKKVLLHCSAGESTAAVEFCRALKLSNTKSKLLLTAQWNPGRCLWSTTETLVPPIFPAIISAFKDAALSRFNAHIDSSKLSWSLFWQNSVLLQPQSIIEVLSCNEGYGRKTVIQVNCANSFTQNQHYNNFRQVRFGFSWIHGCDV